MAGQDNISFLLHQLSGALEKLSSARNEVIELRAALRRHIIRSERSLTDRDRLIYLQHLAGDSFDDLAAEYKLSLTTIRDICRREKVKLKRAQE